MESELCCGWLQCSYLLLGKADMICPVRRSCGVHEQCWVCMAWESVRYPLLINIHSITHSSRSQYAAYGGRRWLSGMSSILCNSYTVSVRCYSIKVCRYRLCMQIMRSWIALSLDWLHNFRILRVRNVISRLWQFSDCAEHIHHNTLYTLSSLTTTTINEHSTQHCSLNSLSHEKTIHICHVQQQKKFQIIAYSCTVVLIHAK